MRYINPTEITECKPLNWDANVLKWKRRILGAINKSKEITAIGNKWSDFKPGFIRKFGDKCWYTEAQRIGTHNDVDHFRPKGAVKNKRGNLVSRMIRGLKCNHSGYWWLAYELSNYRYSCIYSNRLNGNGGKSDFFPLEDEATRAWTPACDYSNENITLLDPCNKLDVRLIVFDQTPGYASPRYTKDQNPTSFEKFQLSQKIYNLNEKTIKGARLSVLTELGKDLILLENTWPLDFATKIALKVNIEAAKEGIIKSCNRKSAFSAAAISLVQTKKEEAWIAEIIPQLDLTP